MKHRGKHPNDDKLFAPPQQDKLREAVKDLSFLLERGYAEKSASQLVGNRYRLTARQIKAIQRIACSPTDMEQRLFKHLAPKALDGKSIEIDGYNLLIITEVALSGAYIFEGVDSCYRDIASVHGTYKKVEETIPALTLLGEVMQKLGVAHAHWYFDAPVSNSGRMKTLLYELAKEKGFPWNIDLANSPDKTLAKHNAITITSDGWIIDQVDQWCNLAKFVIDSHIPNANIVRFY